MPKANTVLIVDPESPESSKEILAGNFDPRAHTRWEQRHEGFRLEDHTGPAAAKALRDAGFGDALSVSRATVEELSEVKGVGKLTAERLIDAAAEENDE